jgi:hypothetical protein
MQYTGIKSLLYAIHCDISVVVYNTLVYNRCCMQYTGISSLLYTIHWYIIVVVYKTYSWKRCCKQYTRVGVNNTHALACTRHIVKGCRKQYSGVGENNTLILGVVASNTLPLV